MKRPEVRAKLSASKLGKPHPYARGDKNPSKRPEVRAKLRASSEKLWQDPEYVKKVMKKSKPNKPEKFLDKLFQKLFPNQIKYIGDGKDEDSIIAGKCPDFTFIDGQKKIIEFFGDYWHGEERTGVSNEQHEQERIDLFAQKGYQTLIIWEHELKDIEKLTERILRFV